MIHRAQPEPGLGGGEHGPRTIHRAQPEPGLGGGEHGPRTVHRAQPEPGLGGGEHGPRTSSAVEDRPRTDQRPSTPDSRGPGRRTAGLVLGLALLAGLFTGYLRMARTLPINSDGSSNALQAWDLLHGNVLLRGWTVSDVSFYSTELVQYALVELVRGLHADVIRVAAAMTYTLLVLCVAMLAKGRATGRAGLVRAALAVAIVLVPQPGSGYVTLLSSPDHTGTGVPLLIAWLVLDRAANRRWLPYLLVVLLAWGEIGDPLVAVLGGLPLVVVSAGRLLRTRRWRGPDAGLLAAGLASVVLAQGFVLLVRVAGGFTTHAPTLQVTSIGDLGRHLRLTAVALAIDFGAYLPERRGGLAVAVGVLHIAFILAVLAAVVLVLVRYRTGDRVDHVLAVGIVANLLAFVVSALPVDQMSAREVVAVAPLGAVLVGRVFGEWLRPVGRRIAVAAVAGVLAVSFVVQAVTPSDPLRSPMADWLAGQRLTYGLGGYWAANSTTLLAGRRVTVVPVSGDQRILAYRWESHVDWYDPARHDARFVILDTVDPTYGTISAAVVQFGVPVQRKDFGDFAVLVYGHNLLVGLPAQCDHGVKPSMAVCVHG